MEGFTIVVTCNKCGSNDADVELAMAQGAGLLGLECRVCGNDNEGMYYDNVTLDRVIEEESK